MTIFQAVILGIIQGITEFFPISSSGHLVIAQRLLGIEASQLAFDVFLHLGTLIAVIVYFRKYIVELLTRDRETLTYLVIGSFPALVAGFLLKGRIEKLFGAPKFVGYMLIVTGVWIALASIASALYKKRGAEKELDIVNTFLMGCAQAVSIIPGISRSGATIATGFLAGVESRTACAFAFVLSIPAVAGATALKAVKIASGLAGPGSIAFMAGGLAATLAGLVSISIFLKLVQRRLFFVFGIYCLLAGFFAAFYLFR